MSLAAQAAPQTKVKVIDLREVYCPTFAMMARMELNKIADGEKCILVARDPQSTFRLKHICSTYGWELTGPEGVAVDLFFSIRKPSAQQ